MVSVPSIIASYRQMLTEVGEEIVVRRYSGSGTGRPKIDRTVLARVTGFHAQELVGTIQQGDRKIIVLAEDIETPTTDSPPQALTLPITASDKIVVRGKELQIISSDDSTRRVQGVLIALEIQARG